MKIIRESIDVADKVLDLYNSAMDKIIPWGEFNKTLVELDKFRKDYSTESALLISEVKTLMMDGMDSYFSASQDVYEFAGLATTHLKLYIKLFNHRNNRKAEAQKDLLIQVLGDGLTKLTDAQSQLKKSSASFNTAFGKLSALHDRFKHEFNVKSEFFESKVELIRKMSTIANVAGQIFSIFGIPLRAATSLVEKEMIPQLLNKMESIKKFYDTLKDKVQETFANIHKTKSILSKEIEQISELKIQTTNTETFVSLDDEPEIRALVIDYVQALIEKCQEYRHRHINKTDLV